MVDMIFITKSNSSDQLYFHYMLQIFLKFDKFFVSGVSGIHHYGRQQAAKSRLTSATNLRSK